MYNHLITALQCPRCSDDGEMTVHLYFGFRDLLAYRIGDRYQWTSRALLKNGGRPPEGNLEGEGYAECPGCRKDFFVKVTVRNDVVIGAEPDPSKAPLVSD